MRSSKIACIVAMTLGAFLIVGMIAVIVGKICRCSHKKHCLPCDGTDACTDTENSADSENKPADETKKG